MVENNLLNNSADIIFWANTLAGAAVALYGYLMLLQARGIINPSPRFIYGLRLSMVCILSAPFAARYQYSESVILYLSVLMITVGILIKIRRKT